MTQPGRAARADRTERTDGTARAALPHWRSVALVGSLALVFLVGLSAPNAARPDLHGPWPLEALLPVALSPAMVTAALWTGVVLGVATVVLGLISRPGPVPWTTPLACGALSLLTTPMGSGDHLNYAAYGRILLQGGDPWSASPIDWAGGHDPISSAVEEPWTTEPSVYGPFVTLLQAGAAAIGGNHLRLVVLAWQVLIVLAWLGIRAGLRRLLGADAHGRIDVLWTLNPLVLTVALLGAHVDTIATALAVTAVVALVRWPGRWGIVGCGVLVALAAGTKFTYAVIGLAVVLTWAVVGPRCGVPEDAPVQSRATWLPRCSTRIGWLLLGALPTLALLHSWTGPHVYDQIARARSSVSLASPWRLVLGALADGLGSGTTRSLISVAAMVFAVVLAVLILRRCRALGVSEGAAVLLTTAALTTAYSLAAPYTLPWYDLLPWAALPALVPGLLDIVLLSRLAIMAIAYVPGRVLGMTPEIEAVTLGLRRGAAPWLQLCLWVLTLIWLVQPRWIPKRLSGGGRDGWARSRGPRPPTS